MLKEWERKKDLKQERNNDSAEEEEIILADEY